MPKAKTIDRVKYTKNRGIIYHYSDAPVQMIEGLEYNKEKRAVIAHIKPGVEICPVCGAELIHESGCVRCMCGWSRC